MFGTLCSFTAEEGGCTRGAAAPGCGEGAELEASEGGNTARQAGRHLLCAAALPAGTVQATTSAATIAAGGYNSLP